MDNTHEEIQRLHALVLKDQSLCINNVLKSLALSNEFPLVRFDVENQTIDLANKLHANGKNYEFRFNPYWIDFKRIDTPLKLLHWITHLSRKEWFTAKHVEQLIYVWSTETRTKIPHV